MSDSPNAVFVYGTLKRGQLRGGMWPCQPISIEPALVHGELYDLGPYPALLPPASGSAGDRIAGEVWTFAVHDMPRVLEVLDEIECYDQPGEPSLYLRVVIEFETVAGSRGAAFTYHYACADVLQTEAARVLPNEAGICSWK